MNDFVLCLVFLGGLMRMEDGVHIFERLAFGFGTQEPGPEETEQGEGAKEDECAELDA